VYTSCGFQSNLQVRSSLARAVTVDNEVATNTRTLHTLNVGHNASSLTNIQKLKTMRYTFLIIITLTPLILFGQVPSGIDTNFGYEKYLKAKYDSIDNLLNKYYKEWLSFDSVSTPFILRS